MIQLHNATVVYAPGERPALDNVSLRVEPGDWVAIVGDNGSGKTTLLAAIAGLVPLHAGTLERDAGVRAALLLQEPDNQFVSSTVRHELALSLPGHVTGGAREARLRQAIDRFQLGAVLDRNPHRLSGGEKQRLAVATVWLEDPHLLLLDEPLAYLDAETRAMVVAFVAELNARGTAVVWATPGDDVALARRTLTLAGGRVVDAIARAAVAPAATRHTPAHTTGPAALRFESVRFGYGDALVFDGLDLEVASGECIGVVGRNSAGKSTLLLLAGGALQPRAGRVARLSPRRGGTPVALYLPQSPERLFFAETVHEEIAFGLRRRGVSPAEARTRSLESLRAAGLDPAEFAERSPFQLSQGEMRRVAFAIADSLAPDLLLLDEPATCLDAPGRAILERLVTARVGHGGAAMMASHDPDHLRAASGRLVSITDRRLITVA
jgi:energy-coupling factor transport system ATP-binding protein